MIGVSHERPNLLIRESFAKQLTAGRPDRHARLSIAQRHFDLVAAHLVEALHYLGAAEKQPCRLLTRGSDMDLALTATYSTATDGAVFVSHFSAASLGVRQRSLEKSRSP
jgi:hypothetical protein